MIQPRPDGRRRYSEPCTHVDRGEDFFFERSAYLSSGCVVRLGAGRRLGAGLGLSPSIPVRSRRLELRARKARRWSRAKVQWEMSVEPTSTSSRGDTQMPHNWMSHIAYGCFLLFGMASLVYASMFLNFPATDVEIASLGFTFGFCVLPLGLLLFVVATIFSVKTWRTAGDRSLLVLSVLTFVHFSLALMIVVIFGEWPTAWTPVAGVLDPPLEWILIVQLVVYAAASIFLSVRWYAFGHWRDFHEPRNDDSI